MISAAPMAGSSDRKAIRVPQSKAPLDAQQPEDQTAESALGGSHGDVALHRGADHRGELGEQVVLVFLAQRHRLA